MSLSKVLLFSLAFTASAQVSANGFTDKAKALYTGAAHYTSTGFNAATGSKTRLGATNAVAFAALLLEAKFLYKAEANVSFIKHFATLCKKAFTKPLENKFFTATVYAILAVDATVLGSKVKAMYDAHKAAAAAKSPAAAAKSPAAAAKSPAAAAKSPAAAAQQPVVPAPVENADADANNDKKNA